MASLIPGYEYDIFISYRHNDNLDGWVTEYVRNLQKELKGTIKEPVSVYFDTNPHDGLLETHIVDKSLGGKLKCLIFIPILSQTYCDPKSFAWQHELQEFNKMAQEDKFGRDIKLRNGNVASRILPIAIHYLDPEDVSFFENEIGSVLRSVDFVFKTSSGVNRPLNANEDHPVDNLNKTFYRDQINKVANAIKEIISGLLTEPDSGLSGKVNVPSEKYEKEDRKKDPGQPKTKRKSQKWLIILFAAVVAIIGAYGIFKHITTGNQSKTLSNYEKSIAVLPFANDSPDKDNEYLCNGMMEEILNQLQKIGDLRVKSRTSVEKYRNPEKDIKVIGQELEVSLILEGSVRKAGDDLRIAAQLIDTKTGDHLWSEIYDGKYTTDIFEFQSSVAKRVASSLNIVIAPLEEKSINSRPTSEILAYDLCAKGNEMISQWHYTFDSLKLRLALNLFDQALEIDPEFISALQGKGAANAEAGNFDSALFYYEKIDKIDPRNSMSASGKGMIYLYSSQPDSALKYWQKSIELQKNNHWAHLGMGQTLMYLKNEPVKGLYYIHKAGELGGNSQPEINQHAAIGYFYIGDFIKALKYVNYALSRKQECKLFLMYDYILFAQGKHDAAFHFLDSTCSINACEQSCNIMRFYLYLTKREFAKAEKFYKMALDAGYKKNITDDIYIACLYKETGRRKEAFSILDELINRIEISVKSSPVPVDDITKLQIAAAWSIMGEKKKALNRLPESGTFNLLGLYFNQGVIDIKTFPGFDNLRNDPQFRAYIKRCDDEKAVLKEQVRMMELKGEI